MWIYCTVECQQNNRKNSVHCVSKSCLYHFSIFSSQRYLTLFQNPACATSLSFPLRGTSLCLKILPVPLLYLFLSEVPHSVSKFCLCHFSIFSSQRCLTLFQNSACATSLSFPLRGTSLCLKILPVPLLYLFLSEMPHSVSKFCLCHFSIFSSQRYLTLFQNSACATSLSFPLRGTLPLGWLQTNELVASTLIPH